MYSLKNKVAKVLPDGTVTHFAMVSIGVGADFPWRCHCKPEENHDHDKLHQDIANRLAARELVIADLHALVGTKGRMGITKYEITDCNIQIVGPHRWVLYVGWNETTLTEPPLTIHRKSTEIDTPSACLKPDQFVMLHPKDCPKPADVLEFVAMHVADNSKRMAKSIRMAGEFLSAKSRLDDV